MIKTIKKVLKKMIPKRFHPRTIVDKIIINNTHNKVFSGPFAGMEFSFLDVPASYEYMVCVSGIPAAYLLGTYELELHLLIEQLCKHSFDTIIDVGAELGQYAIGLAIRNPQANVVAFEMNKEFQIFIKRMAQINKVDNRIVVKGLCDTVLLAASISTSKKCLIVLDCEGAESFLLDPITIPELRGCYILVELHELKAPGIVKAITKLFEDTHKITEIWTKERTMVDFPIKSSRFFPASLLKKYYINSMNEHRGAQMRWFYLEPNAVK